MGMLSQISIIYNAYSIRLWMVINGFVLIKAALILPSMCTCLLLFLSAVGIVVGIGISSLGFVIAIIIVTVIILIITKYRKGNVDFN